MRTHTKNDIAQIVQTRAKVEGINLTEAAVKDLAEIGQKTSLRYAVQLLSPAGHLAKISRQTEVDEKLVKEASELFYDARKSAQVIKTRESEYLK